MCIPAGDTVDVQDSGDVAAQIVSDSSGTPGSIDVSSGGLTLGASATTSTRYPTNVTLTGGTLAIDDTLAVAGNYSQLDADSTVPVPAPALDRRQEFRFDQRRRGASSLGANLTVTQNGTGTFTIGDTVNGHTAPQLEDIASPITTNTTDSAAGAVTINGTITGASSTAADTTVTSTNQPITLGTTSTWQNGGAVTTLAAPGIITTTATALNAQALDITGSVSSITGLLTTNNGGSNPAPVTLGAGDTLALGAGNGVNFANGVSTLNGT